MVREPHSGTWPCLSGSPYFQQGGESDSFFPAEAPAQRLPLPDVRQQPARKVTLTKGTLQPQAHLSGGAHIHPTAPPGIRSIQGIHPSKKVPAAPVPASPSWGD